MATKNTPNGAPPATLSEHRKRRAVTAAEATAPPAGKQAGFGDPVTRDQKKRKTPQMGFGEYSFEGGASTARRDVLRAANKVFPKLAERLAKDVFPVYSKAVRTGFDTEILWVDNPYRRLGCEFGLKVALSEWATAFNAGDEWLLDRALRTMDGWYRYPELMETRQWDTLESFSREAVLGKPFEFVSDGWEIQTFTWSFYSQLVRTRFERALAQYENNARQLAQSQGLTRSPKTHSPINLDWFVLYQFAGMASTQIAALPEYSEHDPTTILKGVKTAAKLVAWNHLRRRRVMRRS